MSKPLDLVLKSDIFKKLKDSPILRSKAVTQLLNDKVLVRNILYGIGVVLVWLLFTGLYNRAGKPIDDDPLAGSSAIYQSIDNVPKLTNPFARELYIQQQAKQLGLTPDGYKKLLILRKHHADVLPDLPSDSLVSPVLWFYQDLSGKQRLVLVWDITIWLLGRLPHVTVLYVGWKYLQEIPQREKQAIIQTRQAKYQAWQVVHSAYGQKGSGARIEALQDLLEQGESLQ